MNTLPAVRLIRFNPEAHTVDLYFLTTSLALRRRGWELELFEVDQLGFATDLSGQDYPIVLRLHGPLNNLAGSWLPEYLFDNNQPMELAKASQVQTTCSSLGRAEQIWLKADESRDATGQALSGLLPDEPKKAKKTPAGSTSGIAA